jgi:hypothetical protein
VPWLRAFEPMRFASFVGVLASASLLACLEPAAPTPQSEVVSVSPRAAATAVSRLQNATRFQTALRVVNTGSRTIYVGFSYEVDKLVDQKWVRAYTRSVPWSTAFATLRSGRTVDVMISVEYEHGVSEPSVLLEHMRGLYRTRLVMSYSLDGIEQLPPDAGFSLPFAVVD